MSKKGPATTKQWIVFFCPVHSTTRLKWEVCLTQIQQLPVIPENLRNRHPFQKLLPDKGTNHA